MKKWTDGKRCQNNFLRLYYKTRRIVNRMKGDDDWSDEQAAEYQEKSLDRIEDLFESLNRFARNHQKLNSNLKLLIILEDLAESERRDELWQRVVSAIEETRIDSKRDFLSGLVELLENKAYIGPKTAEHVNQLFDQATDSDASVDSESETSNR